jgi:hypothetical protein
VILDQATDLRRIKAGPDANERRRSLGEAVDLIGLAHGIVGAATKEPAVSRTVVETHQSLGPHHHRWQRLEQGNELLTAVSSRKRHLASREAVREGVGMVVAVSASREK